MSVYVDSLVEYPLGKVKEAARVKYWCHMWADSDEELQTMARAIGCHMSWFQRHPTLPHYDLSQTYRARAIKEGVIEMEVIDWLRKRRSMGL